MIHDVLEEVIQSETEDENETAAGPLAQFFAEGLITEIVRTEKSGKEGTVYCCQADPSTGYDLVAAKVYRPRTHRSFKNDAVYNEGRVILNKRNARAVARKSEWGRETQFGLWMQHEFKTLAQLQALGSDVPKPLRLADSAILMEYVGDGEVAAPKLMEVELEPAEVRPLFNRIMSNIELWLANDLIHGDLSAYNVLYWDGALTVIDFPQAIDARANPGALGLLQRDVENICHHWSRYGVRTDPERIARHLWQRYLRAEL